MSRWLKEWRATPRAVAVLGPLFAAVAALPAQVPADLSGLVLHARHHRAVDLAVGGDRFQAVHAFSASPYLAWPQDAVAVPSDAAAVAAWLGDHAAELGLGAARPTGPSAGRWKALDSVVFALEVDGVPVFDRFVTAYFRGEVFAGVTNDLRGPQRRVEPLPAGADREDLVYFEQETSDGGFELVLARVVRSEQDRVVTTRVVRQGRTLQTILNARDSAVAAAGAAVFTEYRVPGGTFPDQIWADAAGQIWFSRPLNDEIARFDPDTAVFTMIAANRGTTPDGMSLDDQDRLWTGMQSTGQLGEYDIRAGTWQLHNAPYGGASLAIPTPATWGRIYVTDHPANRITEFDPTTSTFGSSFVLPSPSSWPVQGTEDPARQTMWFTCYSSNRLCWIRANGRIGDVVVHTGGPSFAVFREDKIYYSLWTRDRLGIYDVATRQNVEVQYPVSDIGGPVGVTPSGLVVVGTRSTGYIMVYDPATSAVTAHRIPAGGSGLKDGLTVAPDGVVWFTETGNNRIAKVVLP